MNATPPRSPIFWSSLSAKLLLLTVAFILVSETLIYVPSISRFRKAYLEEALAAGHLAALAIEATPDRMVDDALRDQLLFHAGAYGVVIQRHGARFLALSASMPPAVDRTVDVRRDYWYYLVRDAIETLRQHDNRVLRVKGPSPKEMAVDVEVVIDEAPLRRRMIDYSRRILQLSLIISAITGAMVYLSLQWLMVRPMRRITEAMMAFRQAPEDASQAIQPGPRSDEIGIAQRELAVMQNDVRAALRQKTRLAALGGAVAKINHDLRNSLATAMLVSDKLAASEDPDVQAVTPRLYQAINRAVDLCSRTLDYAGAGHPALQRELFYLGDLLEDVASGVVILGEGRVEAKAEVDPLLELEADQIQLHRALTNLGRNAVQAGARLVRFAAAREDGAVVVRVIDDGPGLSPKAREHLFQPFAGSGRKGGIGLGLVIARDVMRAHGGEIELERSGAEGTVFRLVLPVE